MIVTTQTKQLELLNVGGSEFLHGLTSDRTDVYVWQNGYDDNLVQIIKDGQLIEQKTGSMNEVVSWLAPLGVYDESFDI